jgi:hypothetical protein
LQPLARCLLAVAGGVRPITGCQRAMPGSTTRSLRDAAARFGGTIPRERRDVASVRELVALVGGIQPRQRDPLSREGSASPGISSGPIGDSLVHDGLEKGSGVPRLCFGCPLREPFT